MLIAFVRGRCVDAVIREVLGDAERETASECQRRTHPDPALNTFTVRAVRPESKPLAV